MDLGNGSARTTEEVPAYLDTPPHVNKFDMVSQGNKTIQEVLNDLKKYTTWMIHPPDVYMFHKRFISALCDLLHNEVLKKATTLNSALLISYTKLLV